MHLVLKFKQRIGQGQGRLHSSICSCCKEQALQKTLLSTLEASYCACSCCKEQASGYTLLNAWLNSFRCRAVSSSAVHRDVFTDMAMIADPFTHTFGHILAQTLQSNVTACHWPHLIAGVDGCSQGLCNLLLVSHLHQLMEQRVIVVVCQYEGKYDAIVVLDIVVIQKCKCQQGAFSSHASEVHQSTIVEI